MTFFIFALGFIVGWWSHWLDGDVPTKDVRRLPLSKADIDTSLIELQDNLDALKRKASQIK